MNVDLQELIGREIDLRTLDDFPAHLREQVLASAEPLYVSE